MAYNKRLIFPHHQPQISVTGSSASDGVFVTGSDNTANFTINHSGSLDILSGSVDVLFLYTGSGKNVTSNSIIASSSYVVTPGETGSVPLPTEIASLPALTQFDVVTRSQNTLRGFSNFFRSKIEGIYAIEYLTVAGGGGGGSWVGGGGGAGGVVTGTYNLQDIELGTIIDVEIGAGGAGSYNPGGYGGMPNSSPGGNTELRFRQAAVSSSYAFGGGEGQSWDQEVSIRGNGGSGGGRAKSGTYAGTAGQGHSGGYGYGATPYPCGGGGGYSGAGSSAPASNSVPGTGGAGGQFSLVTAVSLGSPTGYIAGGGGGGCHGPGCNGSSTGGTGGGGNGRSETTATADNGTTNTGGGGGGSGNGGSSVSRGGNGGSGLTVLKIPQWAYTGTTTGSPTVVNTGGYTYIAFTQTGTLTL